MKLKELGSHESGTLNSKQLAREACKVSDIGDSRFRKRKTVKTIALDSQQRGHNNNSGVRSTPLKVGYCHK